MRMSKVKRVIAARSIVMKCGTPGERMHGIARIDNDKTLPISAAAVGTGGWSS
jgi:hypothetical protein